MYLKQRKADNERFRKAGDAQPRTFEQYDHP